MQSLPPALQPLAAYRQFIAYQLVPDTSRPGKTFKYPVTITAQPASAKHPNGARPGSRYDAHDPAIWHSHDEVSAWVGEQAGFGCGFVFTEHDPFFFLDLDDCLQPDGQWSPVVHELCRRFPGAAIEVSQSGRGLHIFGTGVAPRPRKAKGAGFDLYTEARFAALTGSQAQGSAATDHTAALATLVADYLQAGENELEDGWWSEEPAEGWTGFTDDDELLRVAMLSMSAASAFGSRASFADLWHADADRLAACYPPDQGGEHYDASAADAALAQHLAFHTGKNAQRMLELMPRSALARDKWDRPDYLPRTIRKACAQQVDVFKRREVQPLDRELPLVATPAAARLLARRIQGETFLGADQQTTLFEGCCYVEDQHKVLTPDGALLAPGQFQVRFGGFTFAMDPEGKRMVRNAWECFTESQLLQFPKADTAAFRPDRPLGEIVEEGGYRRVNSYVEVSVPRQAGDASRFWRHLELILPDRRDREILVSYMAACVQYKGIKFQWAPLVIGPPGNGKTLLTRCVANAIGKRYVHWPKASKLAKQFNGWMVGKLFYGVEDIYTADAKVDVIEELKPMITGGDGLEIEFKGVDQASADICGNFMFNSNHDNGIRKTKDDRRFAVFFTAQELRGWDVERSEMRGSYFPDLYDWLRAEGYAIVAEMLHTYAIPDEFNPAKGCHRAPRTSTTERAIHAGMGRAEQEIQDRIEQDAPGFRGGWVSSSAMRQLFADERITMPRSRYKDVMQELGYELHPHLTDGRVNQMVSPDNNKPRLYVRAGSGLEHITDPKLVAEAYQAAQLGMG